MLGLTSAAYPVFSVFNLHPRPWEHFGFHDASLLLFGAAWARASHPDSGLMLPAGKADWRLPRRSAAGGLRAAWWCGSPGGTRGPCAELMPGWWICTGRAPAHTLRSASGVRRGAAGSRNARAQLHPGIWKYRSIWCDGS